MRSVACFLSFKPVTFHGDSLDRLRDFPEDARRDAGHEVYKLQKGLDPTDWKPMPAIGADVREIKIRQTAGSYRVDLHCDFDRRGSCAARIQEDVAKNRAARPGPSGSTTAAVKTRIEMTKPQTFANVWDAIEDSREEAATMTMRSNVMIAINEKVRSWNTTQLRAAHRLGITQPRLNDLLHGKINKFSLDTLLTLATRAGLKVKIDVRSAA